MKHKSAQSSEKSYRKTTALQMSHFPVDEAYFFLKKKNFPVEISFSAGTFVCNDLYFRTLQKFTELKSVFVHVPLFPEQIKVGDLRPSLKFESQLEILQSLISLLNLTFVKP